MAKNKSPKILTKKHLARQDRERRQTRLIAGIAIGIIAIVILGIAYGLLNDTLFLNWRNAVSVNGESLSLHEFQVRVRVTRQQLVNQYMQYTQLAQMFGMDPNSDPQMSQSLSQITQQLDTPSSVGGQVIDDMVNDLLIRQYAKANGIIVSAADVEKAAQEALRYYQNGTPSPTLTPTELVYPTLDGTQLALVTPTPTATIPPTLIPTETQTIASTPTSVPTPTPAVTGTATPIPSPTASPTPYTLQGYQTQYQNALKVYSVLGLSSSEFRNIFFEAGLYHDRVLAKITESITHQQEQVWARHILVADEATANDIRAQLDAGADFGALAAQYSIDTGSKDIGGDLGWFGRGKMVAEFEKVAFSLKIGEISQPVKSTFGYHIIQVLGHEIRPLTEQEYSDAVTAAFNSWLQSQRANSKVVINNSWTNFVPTTPTLAQAQANENATATSYVSTYQAENGGQ
jgi:peptidyl-prolyl cis-trans isomerase D